MVGVQVGEQHRVDASGLEAQPREPAQCAAAGIEDQQPPAGQYQRARPAATLVWKRRARAAQAHVQPVGQRADRIGRQPDERAALDDRQGDGGAQQPGERREGREREECGGETAHASGHDGLAGAFGAAAVRRRRRTRQTPAARTPSSTASAGPP